MTAAGTPTATPTATPTPDGNTPTPTATPTSTPGGDTPTPAPTATPTSTPTGELVAIGNLIFNDLNNDGNFDPGDGETGIDNVSVELFNSGDDPLTATPVATTTTAGGGFYEFDNLTPGSYFVFIPDEEFQAGGDLENFVSSTGNGNDETSDQDVDENGIHDADPATNGIQSTDFDLQPNSEVTGEDQSSYTGSLDDDNVNFTADLGFVEQINTPTPTNTPVPPTATPTSTPGGELVAIGNIIFNDLNNDGNFDPGDGETGIDNVSVELFNTGDDPLTATPVATTTTSGGGFYEFDNLTPGSYFVFIPEEEFQASGDLENFVSSTGNGNDETSDQDVDENGIDDANPSNQWHPKYRLRFTTEFSEVTGEDQTSATPAHSMMTTSTSPLTLVWSNKPSTPTPPRQPQHQLLAVTPRHQRRPSTPVPPTETPVPTSTLVNPPTSTPTNTTTSTAVPRRRRPRLPIHWWRPPTSNTNQYTTGTTNGNTDQYATGTTNGYQYTGSANSNTDQYTDGNAYQYWWRPHGNTNQYATGSTNGGSANGNTDQRTRTGTANR